MKYLNEDDGRHYLWMLVCENLASVRKSGVYFFNAVLFICKGFIKSCVPEHSGNQTGDRFLLTVPSLFPTNTFPKNALSLLVSII